MSGHNQEAISRFAHLVLWQATQDGANQVEFAIEERSAPGRHSRISLKVDGTAYEYLPPPAHIYEQVVAYLLQEARITSDENGILRGVLHMERQAIASDSNPAGEPRELPASTWVVWSDGIDRRLVLTRDATNISGR
jgi:hypothetical protein